MNPSSCLVVAADAHTALGHDLCATIVAGAGDQFSVGLHESPLCEAECDLLLPFIDVGNMAQVIAEMGLWRAHHREASIVPLAIGLSQRQLLDLLAAGAFDFATLPYDGSALLARLRRAVGAVPAGSRIELRPSLSPALRELIGSSPAFVEQLAMLPSIAGCDAGVLILGETGTGKEVYARAIHYTSARAARALVAVNCGAIPPELLESELFGHVRGAFTSAHAARAGLVREAEGGTLFLDEIDSLPLPAQAKLLRFLQDMRFRPVGGDTALQADVRVIAASNQDLPALVKCGRFRRDLFFRLHVLTVTLPPLRERAEDVCALALRFLYQFARRVKRPTLGLSPQAVKRLLAHDWPGNVRELQHVIERAVLMAQTATIQAEDLHLPLRDEAATDDESFRSAKARMVDSFERCYIERLLATCGGNITLAAQMAQKNRRAFFELIRKHGISPERFRTTPDLSAG